MNAAQVKHENYMAARANRLLAEDAKRELLDRLRDERERALAWSRAAFPDRVQNGHACPFAAMYAIEEKRRYPDRNPPRAVVERRVLARVARVRDEQDPWWPRVAAAAHTTSEETAA